MSSYSYQPKVFRYQNGCCICKARSSSSRFTSSQKYESEFRHCFNLREQRSGKICNACVLIFKRWRKLPDKYSRNWEHVIDSKDKQGRKLRGRKAEKVAVESPDKFKFVKKHRYIPKSRFVEDLSDDQGLGEDISSSSASSIAGEERLSEGLASMASSLAPSPQPQTHYPCYEERATHKRKDSKHMVRKIDIRKFLEAKEPESGDRSDFLTAKYWKAVDNCCGRVWEGRENEVAVELNFRYCHRNAHHSTCPSASSTLPIYNSSSSSSSRIEDEGVDMYNEESTASSSSSYYGRQQRLSEEHSTGMKMLLHFSHALTV